MTVRVTKNPKGKPSWAFLARLKQDALFRLKTVVSHLKDMKTTPRIFGEGELAYFRPQSFYQNTNWNSCLFFWRCGPYFKTFQKKLFDRTLYANKPNYSSRWLKARACSCRTCRSSTMVTSYDDVV